MPLTNRARPIVLIALLGFSALSTLLGMRALLEFDHTPGAVNSVAVKWPAPNAIERHGDHPALLVFVHPYCSCTIATIDELAKVALRRKPASAVPAITVLFYRPLNSHWAPGALWSKAQTELGAHCVWDEGGQEAKLFGALTSGYTLLYNPQGALLFHGGVTGSRGHAGDNYGLDELLASLDTGVAARRPSLVFGCALNWFGPATPR